MHLYSAPRRQIKHQPHVQLQVGVSHGDAPSPSLLCCDLQLLVATESAKKKKKLILLGQTWSKNISKSLEKRLWQQNVRRQAVGAGLGCLGSPEARAGHPEHRHVEEGQNLL